MYMMIFSIAAASNHESLLHTSEGDVKRVLAIRVSFGFDAVP